MTTKKATRKWRPDPSSPDIVNLSLRVLMPEAELIEEAVKAEATRLGIRGSRNNFCTRAVVAAAKKELGRS